LIAVKQPNDHIDQNDTASTCILDSTACKDETARGSLE